MLNRQVAATLIALKWLTLKLPIRYADAGVNIPRADQAKERIRRLAARTFTRAVVGGIGSFGALFCARPENAGASCSWFRAAMVRAQS